LSKHCQSINIRHTPKTTALSIHIDGALCFVRAKNPSFGFSLFFSQPNS
jgi:hypothetical protein